MSKIEKEIIAIETILKNLGANSAETTALLRNYPFGQGVRIQGFLRVPEMGNAGKFILQNVPVVFLDKNQKYQRGDKRDRQRQMADDDFTHNLTNIVCASRVLGIEPPTGLWNLIDGRQRSGVAVILTQTTINVDLWLTDTYEREAALFDVYNNTMKISSRDRLPARLANATAGNPYYELKAMCSAHGMVLDGDKDPPTGSPRLMSSIEKLRELVVKDKTAVNMALGLFMLLPDWGKKPPSYELIRAVHGLITHDSDNEIRMTNRFKKARKNKAALTVQTLQVEMMARKAITRKGGKDATYHLTRALGQYLAEGCSTNKVTYPA